MNERIRPAHLQRRAVVYVRQSSAYQVTHNLESQRLQYAMVECVQAHGWHEVEVIDADLGKSASGDVGRRGFERLLAQVCLGAVGAVAARELSRFARNSREWQQLVEVCRVVDTLLIDEEAVYDARRTNDRLLLGLKGSLNEYELDVLRQRSQAAREQKARRGELGMNCPVGYVNAGGGVLAKHPDRRVQQAVAMVFEKFLELGSARQVMLWFHSNGLQFPRPCWDGHTWATVWKDVTYHAVLGTLKSPTYAGAYAWGKTETSLALKAGEPRRTTRKKDVAQWSVLERDHHPSYIAWTTYERIQEMLRKNVQAYIATVPGAAKRGASVLAGLLRCRRCGNKLRVRYGSHDGYVVLRYVCHVAYHTTGAVKCISFGGQPLDDAVTRCVLDVIQPGLEDAVELVVREQRTRDTAAVEAIRLEVQAREYEAERARRQYDATDPENRLVAGELESRWNAALEQAARARERLAREQEAQVAGNAPSRAELEELVRRFPAVWHAATTNVRLRKRIVRALIEEIVVNIDEEAAHVVALVHWKGGAHTELRVPRRRSGQSSRCVPTATVDAVRALARICDDAAIAAWLTRSGVRTPGGHCWTRQDVTGLRHRHDIAVYDGARANDEGWMGLREAAALLGIDRTTLRRHIAAGAIPAEQPLRLGPWILNRAAVLAQRERAGLGLAARHGTDPEGTHPGTVALALFETSPREQ
jgi:DNA invertase Pin-like site-specific DNA recombinase